MEITSKLSLSKRAFWDVDFEALDYEKDKSFIVRKAFDRGSWDDMKWCVDCYGESDVLKALQGAAYLRDDTIKLVCVLFNCEPQNFICYTKKLQRPTLGWY